MYSRLRYWCLAAVSTVICAPATLAAPIETIAKQAVVADVETGTVLLNKAAHEPMFPASMTKMMTAHILFEHLKTGKLKLDDTLPVSEEAWRKGGSKMFVRVNERVAVEDLLRGIVIQSGNDACIVVAEGISGSEAQFANLMNRTARELGMTNSHFKNSTGWPDDEHVASPYDLYLLAQDTIVNYPEYYPYYAEKEYIYNGITQPNRNLLLYRNVGVDGLKTGHTEAAGYGITVSGVNPDDGRRIIVVVNGLSSEKERADEAERLLVYAYRNFENKTLWQAGEPVTEAGVWFGEKAKVSLVAGKDIRMTIPQNDRDSIRITVHYTGPIPAPVQEGVEVGKLTVEIPGQAAKEIPLMTGEAVERLSAFSRIVPALQYYFVPASVSVD